MKLSWSLNRHNHLLIKLAVAIFLTGLAFRLFLFKSEELPSPDFVTTPVVDKTVVAAEANPPDIVTVDVSEYGDQYQIPQKEIEDENEMPQKEPEDQNGLPQKKPEDQNDMRQKGNSSVVPEPEDQNEMPPKEPEDQNDMPQKGNSSVVPEPEDQNGMPQKEPEDQNGMPQKKPEDQNEMSQKGNSSVVPEPEDQNKMPQKDLGAQKCDLFTGDWVPNLKGPVYTNASCSLIEGHQNCMRNGRPDTGYMFWQWRPQNCELPPFNAEKFLDTMRNKSWALIGDSISRNHVQSFLCMLSTAEKAIEVYHDEEYKSKRWYFPSYNFSVSVIWSPFLAKAAIFEDNNGVSTSEVELHLDKLDKKWTEQFLNLDYMIISTGKWFLKSSIYYVNDTVVGCHYCPKRNLTDMGFDFAYRKTLSSVMDFIATSKHKGLVFFRTSTPDHFENGEWHNGGTCQRTLPFKQGETEIKDLNRILRNIELEEFEKAAPKAAENGVKLKLLDFTNLLLLRPDGHPGPYREFYPFAKDKNATVQNDCLHWCLPGPLDAWNDVIMEMLVNG